MLDNFNIRFNNFKLYLNMKWEKMQLIYPVILNTFELDINMGFKKTNLKNCHSPLLNRPVREFLKNMISLAANEFIPIFTSHYIEGKSFRRKSIKNS